MTRLEEVFWKLYAINFYLAPCPNVPGTLSPSLERGPGVSEKFPRRDGRVDECAGLENRFVGNGDVGSNPTPSAIFQPF